MPGNVDKTRAAPVKVIIGYDTEFYEKLPRLFPARDMRAAFAANPAIIQETAFRNGSLQGAYFIIAARAFGLDCGPMSGFSQEKVNEEFFQWKSSPTANGRRNPRLSFDEACKVL